MKIGILTFHRAHNYGALLQAFALKTYLIKSGHETKIIDYWPQYHNEDYKLIPYFRSRRFLGKIKALLLLVLGYKRIVKRSNGYKNFMKQQLDLPLSPQYLAVKEMDSLALDVGVYGSDQIWRRSNYPFFQGFSDVFFGSDMPMVKRKITYAASMGVIDLNQQDKDYLKKVLANFDSISVREEDLKHLVDQTIDENVALVLDPVFLLSKDEWASLNTSSLPLRKKKYIFFYQLMASKEAIDFVNRLRDYYDYDVIEIRGRVEPLKFGNRYCQTANPFDFLTLIQNAEIVVSTSFHGVAFSLVFEKQFYALGMNNNSGRVQTLLNNLDISNRLLTIMNQVDLEEKIDYKKVNIRKLELVKQSHSYLFDALSKNS